MPIHVWPRMAEANNNNKLDWTQAFEEVLHNFLNFSLKRETQGTMLGGKQLVFCSPTDVQLDRWRWHQTEFFQKSVVACCATIRFLFCGQQVGTSVDGIL